MPTLTHRTPDDYAYFWPYNPEEHKIRPAPFLPMLQDRLKCPDIVTYWHVHTKNWMVAVKFKRNGQEGFWELIVLNNDPTGENPEITDQNLHRLQKKWFRPEDPKDVSADLKAEYRAHFRKLDDEDRARLSWEQFVARRLAEKNRNRLDRNPALSAAYRKKRIYA